MSTVVIEKAPKSPSYDLCLSLGKGYSFLGFDVKLWDSSTKPYLQMISELNPVLCYHNQEMRLSTSKKAQKSKCFFYHQEEVPCHMYDVLSYKIIEPSDIFSTKKAFVSEYSLVTGYEMKFINDWAIDDNLRIYAPNHVGGNKYCGNLPDAFFNIACSSAAGFCTNSIVTYHKAILCNKNSIEIGHNQGIPNSNDIVGYSSIKLIQHLLDVYEIEKENHICRLNKIDKFLEEYIKKWESGVMQ